MKVLGMTLQRTTILKLVLFFFAIDGGIDGNISIQQAIPPILEVIEFIALERAPSDNYETQTSERLDAIELQLISHERDIAETKVDVRELSNEVEQLEDKAHRDFKWLIETWLR